MAEQEVTPEQLAEELRRLRVADLLLATCSTLVQLAYARLAPEGRDLTQARLAIDALSALADVLERGGDEAAARDVRPAITNLKLAFASSARDSEAKEERGSRGV